MDIDIKKNGKIKLKDTPYYEPIDNTNISFSNMDVGTAMITFQIKKNGLPLQVSKKNVWVYAYLESKNGTRSEVIELDVIDSFEGKVSLQLDSEFLIGATNSTVEGQLYITLHKFNDVSEDFSDTVALQRFTFTVEDALINEISGVTKTEYIRTFDQLKTEVKEKIQEMQENIGNIETLVERVNTAAQDAINKVNDTKDAMIKDMQSQYDETEADLTELRESSIQKLNLAATNYINDIKNAKDEVVQMIDDEHLITTQKFEEYKSDLDEEIQMKLQEYEDFINANKNDFEGIINELNWQKYKLTEDDGNRIYRPNIETTDITTFPAGFYEITTTSKTDWDLCKIPDFPNMRIGHIAELDVTTSINGRKQFIYRHNHYNRVFIATLHTNGSWREWKELTQSIDSTGWQDIPLKNGVVARTFKPQYKIVKTPEYTLIALQGAVSINAGQSDIVIGTVPVSDILPENYNFVQNTSIKGGKVQFTRMALRANNDLLMERSTVSESDGTSTDWVPINLTLML